jgi:sigma-B regulation protein RsbU (phosphoserine phosphatase)
MAELRAYLRGFLLMRSDVGEIVGLVNRALAGDTPVGHFATLLLARLEPRTRSLTYVSAGHPTGYVLSPAGAVKTALPSTDIPLGIMPDASFTAAPEITLDPGEGILLLTDGILEAHTVDETLFGIERTLALVQANWNRTARQILDQLYGAVRSFCGAATQRDDMTAIVIKVASPGGAEPLGERG